MYAFTWFFGFDRKDDIPDNITIIAPTLEEARKEFYRGDIYVLYCLNFRCEPKKPYVPINQTRYVFQNVPQGTEFVDYFVKKSFGLRYVTPSFILYEHIKNTQPGEINPYIPESHMHMGKPIHTVGYYKN